MKNYEFTLILADVAEITSELENAIFEAGCDDALLGSQNGVVYLDFEREANSFVEAVVSAIRDVSKAGVSVARLEPDDLVSASDVARRLERSRASISQLIKGDRGPGRFPAPVTRIRQNAPYWRWSEVATWLTNNKLIEQSDEVDKARNIAWLNSALDVVRLNIGAKKTTIDTFLKTISADSPRAITLVYSKRARKNQKRIKRIGGNNPAKASAVS
jgi:predicted DNA-binding transcriptional regulator AlpA